MIAIEGNTFPVKDQLKALGGRWDPAAKAWNVPDDKAEEARALVAGAGGKRARRPIGSAEATLRGEMPEACRTHNKRDGSWWLKDARGIEVARVCDRCKRFRMAGYRPEIFTSANYWHDEPIEAD